MGSELVRTRDICPGYLHVPSDFALLNALGALASVDARLELGVDLLGDVGGVLDGHDLSAVVCPLVHDLSLGVMISGRAVVKSGKSADGEFGADGERGVLRRGICVMDLTSLRCLRARYFWGRLMSAYPGTSFSKLRRWLSAPEFLALCVCLPKPLPVPCEKAKVSF